MKCEFLQMITQLDKGQISTVEKVVYKEGGKRGEF